jgi:putative peptidoglycan lipid II flippase
VGKASFKPRRYWGGRTFRFSFSSFRYGQNFSIRRFSITEAALLLMMAYLTSKGLGVIRQTIFNALFGTGFQASAYYAASRLPDTLFNLIAGGTLSIAFIPVFLFYEKEHGSREVWRLTSLVFNLLLVTLTVFVLIAEFLAPTFVSHILVPGFSPSEQALTTTLTRIMLVQPLILGLGTIATAILNGKRQFLLPAISIAIYDLGLIVGLLFSLTIPGVGIYGPTFGLLASAICQVAVQIPGILKQGAHYSFIWNLKHPGLLQVMRLLGPNLLAVGIASIGFILDTHFASYLPDPASIPAIQNAYMIFTLPLTLIAQAVGQSLLPQITTQATHGRYVRMSSITLKIVGGSVLVSLPITIIMYLLGMPLIRVLFQHGAFTAHSSTLTYTALIGYAVGLPGLAASALLISTFYALKDAWTPLLTNVLTLVLRISLIVLFLKLLTVTYAILAIPLAMSISGVLEAGFLGLILFARLNAKMKTDKGMQRLVQRRLRAKSRPMQTKALVSPTGK